MDTEEAAEKNPARDVGGCLEVLGDHARKIVAKWREKQASGFQRPPPTVGRTVSGARIGYTSLPK